MEIDTEQLVSNAIRDGLLAAVKGMGGAYNSPFIKAVETAMGSHSSEINRLLSDSIGSCIACQGFRESVASAVRAQLAKTLVARFGGEIEKQINVLKSDPTTRARITLAIEEIVKSAKARPNITYAVWPVRRDAGRMLGRKVK